MTYIENAVPVEEIAQALRSKPATVEADARTFGLWVGVDWAGRPAVSDADAHGLVSGRARANHEQAVRQADLQRRAAEWVAERSAVNEAAWSDAYKAAVSRGTSAGDARAKAVMVGWDAGHAFERKLPRELEDYVHRVYTQRPSQFANEVA